MVKTVTGYTYLKVPGTLSVNTVSANGANGTAGQALFSNGSGTYWANSYNVVVNSVPVSTISAGNGLIQNVVSNTATIYVNANTGLVANTSGLFVNAAYVAVNTAAQYTWTNTHTFSNAIYANTVNAASFTVGTGFVANTTALVANTDITLTINNKQLKFATVNASAYAYFIQQSDDNFVFYTTNTAYGTRPVWSIFANSITSNLNFSAPVNFAANVGAITSNGTTGTAGQVLTSNGTSTYWSTATAVATVNTAAQYTWTNTHTFQANVSFTGNGVGLSTNTGAIYFNQMSDANWKIGRNTGGTTKLYYTNNSLDIIAANSNLEGIALGFTGNSYLETGYAGTFTRLPIYVGNTSVNLAINSTSIVGNNISIASSNTSVFYNYNGQVNASAGQFLSNAYAALSGYGGNYLAFGQQTNFHQWIQSGYSSAATPVYYSIVLNPLGGNVGIGNTAPTNTLSVNGTGYISGNVSLGANLSVVGNEYVTGLVNATSYNTGGGYGTATGGAIVNTTLVAVGNSTVNTAANSSFVATSGVFLYPQSGVSPNTSEGSVFYDSINHCLNFYTDDASTPQEIGQQQFFRAVNKTGSTLSFGQAVYISGAQGNRPTIALACANSATTYNMVGIISSSSGILNNAEGWVTTSGLVQGYNTSSFTTGAILYLSATTPGALTSTEPSYPNYNIAVAQALNSTNNGKIYLSIVPNYLAGIPNTAISISNGTLLTYSNNFTFDYTNNVLHIGNSTINTSIGLTTGSNLYSYVQLFGNSNNSLEESMVNSSTGNNASSDYIAYDSAGISSANYIDLGINGNGFSQSTWTINGPSDAYLYSANTNLSIGTQGANYLNFFTGNTLAANERLRITPTGNVGINNTAPVNTLSVNGTTYLGGNVTVTGANLVVSTGLISGNGAGITSVNAIALNGQPASYYTNATNITTGTLPYAQLGSAVVNTSGNFSLSGNTTLAGTNTVISSNLTISGATVTGTSTDLTIRNATVSGNLIVSGTVTSINVATLIVNDNIIELGDNNTTTDVVDTGFYSPAGNSTAIWYSGIARIAASSTNTNPVFRIFGSNTNPNTSTTIDTSTNTSTGSLQAYLIPYGTGGAFVVNSTAVNITANSTVSSTINANSHNSGTTGTGTGGLIANSTVLFLGNNTINAAVNTTTLYIGGNVIANSTGANNAFNLGGTAAASYQLNSTLSANVATLTANNANNLLGLTWVSPGAIGSTTANTINATSLSAANLTLTTNTATIGTATYHVANGNMGINNSAPTTTLSVNGTGYIGGKLTVASGGGLTPTSDTSGIRTNQDIYLDGAVSMTAWNIYYSTSPAGWYYRNTGPGFALRADGSNAIQLYYAANATGGSTASPGVAWTVQANTGYMGIGNTAPVDKLSVNGTTYLGGNVTATSNVNVTNYVNAATLSVGTIFVANTTTLNSNGFIANSTGVYATGLVNATSYNTGSGGGSATGGITVNTTNIIIGNSTVNVSTNSTHFYAGNTTYYGFGNSTADALVSPTGNLTLTPTSITVANSTANIFVVNTTSSYYGTNVILGNSSVTVGLQANGGYGTSGQVLASNGSATYWTTFSGGATLTANTTDTATYYLPMANATSGSWSNGVVANTKLYFVPATGTLSATIFNSLSDENQKTNIKTITNPLNKISELRGVSFNWKETNEPSIGVIAQEVEKVLPELVAEKDGVKSVNYDGLIGVLIESIKELKEEIRVLKQKKTK